MIEYIENDDWRIWGEDLNSSEQYRLQVHAPVGRFVFELISEAQVAQIVALNGYLALTPNLKVLKSINDLTVRQVVDEIMLSPRMEHYRRTPVTTSSYYYENTYELRIFGAKEKIENILGKSEGSYAWWSYSISDSAQPIDKLLQRVHGHWDELCAIGVSPRNVSVIVLREYENQCNMEFSGHELAQLSQLGISLGISCWVRDY